MGPGRGGLRRRQWALSFDVDAAPRRAAAVALDADIAAACAALSRARAFFRSPRRLGGRTCVAAAATGRGGWGAGADTGGRRRTFTLEDVRHLGGTPSRPPPSRGPLPAASARP